MTNDKFIDRTDLFGSTVWLPRVSNPKNNLAALLGEFAKEATSIRDFALILGMHGASLIWSPRHHNSTDDYYLRVAEGGWLAGRWKE